MPPTVIETRNLSKRYGRHIQALRDLDLSVHEGEVYGFLGPNGAGKTTTIRLLLDLLRPSTGEIRVLGLDPRADGLAIRHRVGYMPGELPFGGRQTSWELLTYLGGLRVDVDPRPRIRELADRFDLDLHRPIQSLSKGNKQKIGLVQAFMHDPELLILDEPSSGLDPLLQREFLSLVREVRAAGRTVFMSSHILAEVEHIADRIAILRDGKLVAVEDVQTLRENTVRQVEIVFATPIDAEAFSGLPGLRDVRAEGDTLHCTVEGNADALVKTAARFTVVSMLSQALDLEDAFLEHYMAPPGGHDAG